MSDRKGIRSLRYDSPTDWEQQREATKKIIKEDTGMYEWMMTRSYPPIEMPPPMTVEGLEKLKALKGVKVLVEDDKEDDD